MIEVVLSNGDRAYAETPEAAAYAAATMIRESTDYTRPTAMFYVDDRLVRQDVSLAELRGAG